MAIHTEYSVRMNSAYPPTTRRSPLLPASARKVPRLRLLATVDHLIPVILVTRYPVKRPRHQPAPAGTAKRLLGAGGSPHAGHTTAGAPHSTPKPVPHRQGRAAPPARHHQAILTWPWSAGRSRC